MPVCAWHVAAGCACVHTQVVFTGTLLVVPDVATLANPGERVSIKEGERCLAAAAHTLAASGCFPLPPPSFRVPRLPYIHGSSAPLPSGGVRRDVGDGVVGLGAGTGAREMTYRTAFLACAVQVCVRLCMCRGHATVRLVGCVRVCLQPRADTRVP